MTDVADLRVRASADGVSQTARQLDGLTQSGGRAERATDSLVGTIGKFASATALAAGVVAGLNKVVAAQRQFDVLNAGLVTATGSAESAAVAFEALTDFAQKTPYDLGQAVEGFTKLVNLGLTPSERALTSYGNTASAMGKDLSQMIEAVADASTGEFERLKEFGVKAKQQGDQVTLTFQGVKTTVANEAGAIEDYLIGLGENQFAGAMARRMDTLDGALSNLGDTWDATFRAISQGGVGDVIADAVNVANDALSSFNEWLQSGELQGAIASIGVSFGPWVEDAKEAVEIVQSAIQSLGDWIEGEAPGIGQFLIDAFADFPENVRAVVQLATVHVAWFVEEVRLSMEAAKGYIDAIRDGWGGSQLADVFAAAQAASDRNKQNLRETVDLTLQELQATKDSAKAASAAAVEKAGAAKRERDARRAANEGKDRLAGFGTDRPTAPTGGGKKPKADRSADRNDRDYQNLVESLRTEEETLQASYDKRRSIIEGQANVEASTRQDLMRRLDDWRKDEEDKITASKQREYEGVRQSLMTEEEAIQASYDKRKKIVEEAQGVSDAARAQALERLKRERDEDLAREQADRQSARDRLMEATASDAEMRRAAMEQEIAEQKAGLDAKLINDEEYFKNKAAIEAKYDQIAKNAMLDQQVYALNTYGSTLGAVGQMMNQFAQGHGKNAERMFKISKAFNMASAIMSMAAGIMEAQKEPNMYLRIAESIRIAALGAMQIASIKAQQFSGAYDKGGDIPAGKFGIVGERGMEIVQGPANVVGRQDTARMLRQAAEGGGGDTINNVGVTIQVNVGENGAATSTTTARTDGMDAEQAKKFGQMIDLRVRDVILREQRQGGMLSPNR